MWESVSGAVAAATKKDPFLTRVCFSLLLVQWCSKFCVKRIKKGEGRGVNDCQVCKREVDRKRGGGAAYQTLVRHLGTVWTGNLKTKTSTRLGMFAVRIDLFIL